MSIPKYPIVLATALLAALLPLAPAQAQLEGLINKGGKPGAAGGLGQLGNMAGLTAGSTGNVAGLLQYCITNNYLSAAGASPVQDKLLGKIGGDQTAADSGYKDGAMGVLKSSDGKQVDLTSGLQAQAAKQICKQVLAQGKSILKLP